MFAIDLFTEQNNDNVSHIIVPKTATGKATCPKPVKHAQTSEARER
jgi:hypothetical protein